MTESNLEPKKRKRKSSTKLESRKRAALDRESEISIILHEDSQYAPVIATVPGIDIDPSITFKSFSKKRPNTHKEKPNISKQELLLQSSDHPKIDYVAREENFGEPDVHLKHYVGVYDPATGQLEVVEARKMIIRGIIREHQYNEELEVVSDNIREQRNVLGQTFGTKKARKAIASVTENAISPGLSLRNQDASPHIDSVTATMLSNVAEATKDMKSREDLAKAADDVKPRPKANESATRIEDIYTIESLIGIDVLKMVPVKEWQDKTKAHEEVFVASKFVANRIQKCVNSVEKLKILRFMLMLLDIYRKSKRSREGRKLPKKEDLKQIIGDMPEVVLAAAKRKFTEKGVINKYHGDLLTTHLCAMSLLVDDFQTDTCDLKEDLQLDLSQITKFYSEIGVKSHVLGVNDVAKYGKVVASQRRVAKLKLPLVFPKLSFGGRRR